MISRFFTYAVVGFATGFMLAMFALAFAGALPPGPADDLSQTELEQRALSIRVAFAIGVAASVFAMVAGAKKIPVYWACFTVVFGIIAIIPIWPSRSGSLLPLATPYVNLGFHIQDLILLTLHVLTAGFITHFMQRFGRNRQAPSDTVK